MFTQSKAFAFLQTGTGDSRSIIFYLKNEIRPVPSEASRLTSVGFGVGERRMTTSSKRSPFRAGPAMVERPELDEMLLYKQNA